MIHVQNQESGLYFFPVILSTYSFTLFVSAVRSHLEVLRRDCGKESIILHEKGSYISYYELLSKSVLVHKVVLCAKICFKLFRA
jgi:hypothetical protein